MLYCHIIIVVIYYVKFIAPPLSIAMDALHHRYISQRLKKS